MNIDTLISPGKFMAWLAGVCMLALIASVPAHAQRTINVSPGVGTLNTAIDSDTTATGARVDSSTVYVLERDGVYLLEGSIEHRGYHLTIMAEDGDGARPQLIPAVGEGGEASRPFRPRGDLTIKGLYVTGQDELGGLTTRIIRVSENDVSIRVDDCHLDKDGQSGFRIDGTNTKIYLTNSIVSNIGVTSSPENGRGLDDRGNPIDTLWFVNNTFYNLTSQVMRDDGGVIGYANFSQNTVVNTGIGSAVELGPVVQGKLEDNLIINGSFYGSTPSLDNGNVYVMALDSLTQDEIDMYGEQSFTANNNNIYLSSSIEEAYPDTVSAPVSLSGALEAYVEEQGSAATFISEDVSFTSAPGAPVEVVNAYWSAATSPEFPTEGEPFDFEYSATAESYTAGTSGQQLGALTWFGVTVSNEKEDLANTPKTFELNGNYPNPFNPTTNISFNLPQAAEVTVDVFSVIGQKVLTIPAQQMSAGTNQNIMIDAANLTSGVYLYRVTAKTASDMMINTGRMTLIK